MTNDNVAGNVLLGVLVGAVLGVAIGFLFAPKSGRESRHMIVDTATSTRDKAGEIIEKAKDRVTQMRQRGEEKMREAVQQPAEQAGL